MLLLLAVQRSCAGKCVASGLLRAECSVFPRLDAVARLWLPFEVLPVLAGARISTCKRPGKYVISGFSDLLSAPEASNMYFNASSCVSATGHPSFYLRARSDMPSAQRLIHVSSPC